MKTLFQGLDSINKRIIVIALSVSTVLLSASVLFLTASKSFAQNENATINKPIIGLGCDESCVYYFDSDYKLKRRPKSTAKWD
jgi:hypothetical protein